MRYEIRVRLLSLLCTERGGEASKAIAATDAIAFGTIQRDRAESPPQLVGKVTIVSSHHANNATKLGYRLNGDRNRRPDLPRHPRSARSFASSSSSTCTLARAARLSARAS